MSKEKEILRLHHQGISQRSISKMLHTSDRTIRKVVNTLKQSAFTYEDILDMDDETVTAIFRKKKEVNYIHHRPDCDYIHKELKRKGVTPMLLWEEYVEQCILSDLTYLKYTQFCNVYKEYVETHKLTMHIHRKPGEREEVDWAGTTIDIYDLTLENVVRKVYLFVGCLPFSQYMYASASQDMKAESWITHHIRMYTCFGGVPLITVPDNCKTAVISRKKYEELIIHPSYLEMAEYYSTAILPARVRAPKDKPSVEGSVGYLTTQIIARLRNYQFTSLNELNTCIFEQLEKLNKKSFQKREYSRKHVFENEEKEYLTILPRTPYEYAIWKIALVAYNYHISFERNYYSVPYRYLKQEVQLRITNFLIEIYYKNERIASHPRVLGTIGKYMTSKDHMPNNHKNYQEWSSQRIKKWAQTIGPNIYQVICGIFDNARLEQQVYNQCISILKLKDKYSAEMLEASAEIIIEKHITPRCKNFKVTLENIQEKKQVEEENNAFAILRGATYYGGEEND